MGGQQAATLAGSVITSRWNPSAEKGYVDAVPPPWTQVVELSWAPELRFYENRIFVLRELEARQELAQFRVSDHSIAARLSEREALQVGPTGASLTLVGPEARLQVLRDAASLVVKDLIPSNVLVRLIALQFLTPLPAPFDDARRRSIEHVVSPVLEGATDYALLVDGSSKSVAATFQVELGVISPEEAPLRVGRVIGRLTDSSGGVPRELLPESAFFREDYPAAALFSDWNWSPEMAPGPEGDLEGVFRVWDAVVEESERMLRRVQVEAGATDHYHGVQEEAP